MRAVTAGRAVCAVTPAPGDAVILAGATRISLRPVSAGDQAALAGLFARLSPASRHRRFLSAKPRLTARELAYFTDIDHCDHEAIAAVDVLDNSMVGVARYVRHADRADAAEVAIEVADAFHRSGIGTALALRTIELAQANGIRLLTATTLWENRAARGLLSLHGFHARGSSGGAISYELRLEPAAGQRQTSVANPDE